MDPAIPDPPNPLGKVVWENILQLLAAGFLIVVLIVNWKSADRNIKIGISLLIITYLMIRITFILQALKFAKRIEEQKKSQTDSKDESQQIYEDSLK